MKGAVMVSIVSTGSCGRRYVVVTTRIGGGMGAAGVFAVNAQGRHGGHPPSTRYSGGGAGP